MQAALSTETFPARRIASAALAACLCGIYCLFCCGLHPTVAAAAASKPESSCAAHACCRYKPEAEAAGAAVAAAAAKSGAACCAPFGQAAILAEKRTPTAESAAQAATHITLPAPQTSHKNSTVARSLRVPDRGGTYLRLCVFLI